MNLDQTTADDGNDGRRKSHGSFREQKLSLAFSPNHCLGSVQTMGLLCLGSVQIIAWFQSGPWGCFVVVSLDLLLQSWGWEI